MECKPITWIKIQREQTVNTDKKFSVRKIEALREACIDRSHIGGETIHNHLMAREEVIYSEAKFGKRPSNGNLLSAQR